MGSERRSWLSVSGSSALAGAAGGMALGMFYVVVVAWASGSWQHLIDQMQADWYLLILVIAGFGTQVALLAELRCRRRREMDAAAASGAGAGASAVGMVACCAHHVADLLPFLGAGGAATFLYDYKLSFVLAGASRDLQEEVAALARRRSGGDAGDDRGGG
ncbi:MAG: hypothetical protein WD271_09845 [Acidimicrobiia bacterium]